MDLTKAMLLSVFEQVISEHRSNDSDVDVDGHEVK